MLIARYINQLILAGYRPRTVTDRRRCILAFASEVAPHQVSNATRTDIEAFLARPLAPESRRAYRSHLRAFFSWACEEGLIGDDPTAKVPPIRVPRGQPRPISTDHLATALDLATGRMRAWLLLMSLSGLRCIEVSGLRPRDLTVTEAGTLLFLRECKGGGSATVPAHDAVLEALKQLPIRNGLWWECSPKTISRYVREYLTDLGIPATAHQLRHFAGTAWYRASGHDLLTTSRLLRHANVDTSTVYAQLDPTRPAEVVSLVTVPSRPSLRYTA